MRNMDRGATSFRRNTAVVHIADSFMHEILASAKFEICSLPGYYAAYSNNCLLTFRDNLSVTTPRVKKYKKILDLIENCTNRLHRSFGKELSQHAVYYLEQGRYLTLRGRSLKSRICQVIVFTVRTI
jgi:hypothetical protein